MSKQNLELGKEGEGLAEAFLKDNRYEVLRKNYRTKLGEIDIIARDKDTICFIEVKTRGSERFGLPQEAVTRRKQYQISKAALLYLKENNLLHKSARFDVVLVTGCADTPKVGLIKNAFELGSGFTY